MLKSAIDLITLLQTAMRRPYWIPYNAGPYDFPPVENALEHPDGLLAIGGDLSPSRLIVAYRQGIFPWYSDDEPILWWAPSQRMVLYPSQVKISRSLRKTLRKGQFTITIDKAFREVMEACAGPRRHQDGTWITEEMLEAYCALHEYELAHSVEAWLDDRLVGGLYGVALGKIFFGESMFAWQADASKVAFVQFVKQLQRWHYELIDCQIHTAHLASLGAVEISRQEYQALLDRLCDAPSTTPSWQFDADLLAG